MGWWRRARGGSEPQQNVFLPPAEIEALEAAYAAGDDARVVQIEDATLGAIDPAPFFDPWRVSTLARTAHSHDRLGHRQEASERYDRGLAIAVDPVDVEELAWRCAITRTVAGRYDEAEEAAGRFLALPSATATERYAYRRVGVLLSLADVHWVRGDEVDALLAQVVTGLPGHPPDAPTIAFAHVGIAELELHRGNVDAAHAQLDAAERIAATTDLGAPSEQGTTLGMSLFRIEVEARRRAAPDTDALLAALDTLSAEIRAPLADEADRIRGVVLLLAGREGEARQRFGDAIDRGRQAGRIGSVTTRRFETTRDLVATGRATLDDIDLALRECGDAGHVGHVCALTEWRSRLAER